MVPSRKLRVAAVQVSSANGEIERNLAGAERFVEDAVGRGAELMLCPEFLAAAYIYDDSVWKCGELRGGPTERWLRRLANTPCVSSSA